MSRFSVRLPPPQPGTQDIIAATTSNVGKEDVKDETANQSAPQGKVYLDEKGRMIDELGNIINLRQQKELQFN